MPKRLPLGYYASQSFYRFLAVAIFLLPAMGWSSWCIFQRTAMERARTRTVTNLWRDALADNPHPDPVPLQRAINELVELRKAGADPTTIQTKLDLAKGLIRSQADLMRGASNRNTDRARKIGLIARAAKADHEGGFIQYMVFPPNPKLTSYR